MYLGIEIGGSKLQLGLGQGDGQLKGLWRSTVDVTGGAEGIRRQIVQAVPELLARADLAPEQVRGIGIGFGGPVEDVCRAIIKSHQIAGWDGFPLADWLSDLLGWPAVLGNDADVAGLAEARFGAGKGLSPILYITLGSGIGGGLIINGEIYRGCGKGAAEIGHLRIPLPREKGIHYLPLEQIASGWGIQEWARQEIDRGKNFLGKKPGEALTTQEIAEAALQENDQAIQILSRVWDSLAEAICHIIALLCPRRIVIGGGVSLMGEKVLFEPLRQLVAMRVFKPFADCYDIVPAALGEEVVVHGALALARQRLEK